MYSQGSRNLINFPVLLVFVLTRKDTSALLGSVRFSSGHVGLSLTLTRLELIGLLSHFLGSTRVDDPPATATPSKPGGRWPPGSSYPYVGLLISISGYPRDTTRLELKIS